MSSILNDVKHSLGIPAGTTAFDQDLILFINGVFGTLTQLNVGPKVGFQITDETAQWEEYYTDPRLNAVKSYMFVCLKILFDPPATGFVLQAMKEQKLEMEYRLNVVADYG